MIELGTISGVCFAEITGWCYLNLQIDLNFSCVECLQWNSKLKIYLVWVFERNSLCAYISNEPGLNHAFALKCEAFTCSLKWRQVQPHLINFTCSFETHLSLIQETNLSWHKLVLFHWNTYMDALCTERLGLYSFVPVEKKWSSVLKTAFTKTHVNMFTCKGLKKFSVVKSCMFSSPQKLKVLFNFSFSICDWMY